MNKENANPGGGRNQHGTHCSRTRINALFADLHSETLPWNTLKDDSSDNTAQQRWNPNPP